MSETPPQLSDEERVALKAQLTTKSASLKSISLGLKLRGNSAIGGAVVAQTPASLTGAELSVCGTKDFMTDERRIFTRPDGTSEEVDCAHIANLDIVDSPVHVHGVTYEIYQVLSGTGKMVLDKEVVPVKKGTVISLPPGVEHGLVSDDPNVPVNVLLTFIPGLAPKTKPEFRDEAIITERASVHIERMGAA